MSKVFLYYVSEMPNNVIRSQVVEYIALQEKLGVQFDILFHIRKGEYIKRFSEIKKFKAEFGKKIKSKISFFPIANKNGSMGTISAAINLYLFLLKFRKAEKIIIHARGGFSSHIAALVKNRFKNIRIIYDVRADALAEFRYYSKLKNVPESKIEKSLNRGKRMEKYAVENVDHIFTVSDILTNRYKENYSVPDKNIDTIPCVADENIFAFDKNIRAKIRGELNIGNRFTFVYAGGIGYYHYSDKVFEIMGGILNKSNEIFFIILTPDITEAEKYASKYLQKNSFIIKSAGRNEVPNYLMAADMGMLIREKHPLNEVAAPTKFAEYVMTGLPVMISEFIGDYSDFVLNNNIGIVLSNNAEPVEYITKFEEFKNDKSILIREDICKLGKENFSKQKYSQLMNKTYLNL